MTPESKQKRVSFCKHHLDMNTCWNNIIFSDESWFELGMSRQYVWRHFIDYGDDVCIAKKAHPEKIMIWGAVGYNYKSPLIFIDGQINGDYYLNNIIRNSGFLESVAKSFPDNNWILQQDNARPHIRRDIVEAMRNLNIKLLDNWPLYSPDLNIIEVIWAIMKSKIKCKNPNNKEELKRTIQEVWDNLSLATINSLIAQMPRRLQQAITNNGTTITHLE